MVFGQGSVDYEITDPYAVSPDHELLGRVGGANNQSATDVSGTVTDAKASLFVNAGEAIVSLPSLQHDKRSDFFERLWADALHMIEIGECAEGMFGSRCEDVLSRHRTNPR